MKKLVLGVFISVMLSGTAIASNEIYTIGKPTLFCYNESDAIPADIAIGLQNIAVVKDYMQQNKCILVTAEKQVKIKILNTKNVPMGKSYIPVHKIKIINSKGGKPPKGLPLFWMGDTTRSYK